MQVEVRLHAVLRKYLPQVRPGEGYRLELPERATVADMMAALAMPVEDANQVFVNGQVASLSHILADGDCVRVFSPIGGGSLPRKNGPRRRQYFAREASLAVQEGL